jgi:hypothetical protein
MALNLQLSVGARNRLLDSFETELGTSPKLQIWTGTQPADCATTDSGTKLVEMTLPSDFMNAASSGTKTLLGTWSSTGITNGTAGYFRIKPSSPTGTNAVAQGTVGTSGTDMTLDNTSISTGQTVTINSFTLTAPNP